MCKMHFRLALPLLLMLLTTGYQNAAFALVKGIYISQDTLEDTQYITYLIQRAKAVGISTFVIDLEKPDKKYSENIELVKNSGIHYVARIIVFPDGGHPEQMTSPAYWAKRYALVKKAVTYGAQQIQLDYIRYSSKQHASPDNAKNVVKVVQWFKTQLAPTGIPLQADVFGIASFGESKHIGQNLKLMAQTVDALCPMVYPSHFEPYRIHAVTPYKTILDALNAIHAQFDNKMPVKLYAYIELSNYRYPLSKTQRIAYIKAQMKAVKDAGADGWYAWSAHNEYDYLFNILGDASNSQEPTQNIQADNNTPDSTQHKAPTPMLSTSLNNMPNNPFLFPWPLGSAFSDDAS